MTIGGVQFDKDILDLALALQRMKDDHEKRRQLAEKYPKYYSPLPEGNPNTFADYKAMVDYEVKRQLRCKVREQWYFEQGRIYQNLQQIQYRTMIQQINMFPPPFEYQLAQAHPNCLPFIPASAHNFNSYPWNNQMFQMPSLTLQNYQIPDNGVADVENELEEPEVSSPDENTEQFYPSLGHQPLPNSQPFSQPHCNFCPSNNSLFPTLSSHQLYPEVPIDNQVERQQHFAIKQEQQDVFNRGCNMEQIDLETCSMNRPLMAVIKQELSSWSEDENNYPKFPLDSSSETVASQPLKVKQEQF